MRRATARGFTLIETLVALVVFALVCAAGVGVMAWASDNRGVLHGRMERLAALQRSQVLLKADLSQAAPRRVRDVHGAPARTVFDGGRAGAPLLALTRRGWSNPDAEARASLQYVEYRLDGDRLERRVHRALDGGQAEPPQVLLDGVEAATVAFRFQGQWMDGWQGSPEDLPEAVRLDLELADIGVVRQLFLLPEGAW